MALSQENLQEFVEYVHDFYGFDGVYPMIKDHRYPRLSTIFGATRDYLKSGPVHCLTKETNYRGDTVDREAVRNILESYGYQEEGH